jgi:hypothetical protein
MHWDTGTLQPIWIVDLIFSPEKAIKKLNEIQLYNWDFEIMKLLKPKIKDYPGQHIEIKVDIPDLDFSEAKDIAKRKAKEICADPMLLSWYQGKTGESYPNLECGPGDKPAWIVYAESRGGDLTIDINEGDYIFIYLSV